MIRAATPADAEAIARVHVQAWRESYRGLLPDRIIDGKPVALRTAQWRSIAADPVRILRVIDAGEIVGFGAAGPARNAALGADGEVAAIYLLARVKRRGLGRTLFMALLDALRAAGFGTAGLWVLADNVPARRFYEALGGRTGASHREADADFAFDEIAYLWDLQLSVRSP